MACGGGQVAAGLLHGKFEQLGFDVGQRHAAGEQGGAQVSRQAAYIAFGQAAMPGEGGVRMLGHQREQVARVDHVLAAGQQHGALQHAAQFGQVAGPGLVHQGLQGMFAQAGRQGLVLGSVLRKQGLGQCRQLVHALAQRRQCDVHRLQAQQQFAAELAILRELFQIGRSGGDKPAHRGNRRAALVTQELAVAQEIEQLVLQQQGQMFDVVQIEHAAFGLLDAAAAAACARQRVGGGLHGAAYIAAHILAEQLDVQCFVRETLAIEHDEGLAAGHQTMQAARQRLLAGTEFALQQ